MIANFLKRNSSTILTCFGAVGVAATAIVAVRATPKAIRLLEETREEKGEDLTKMEVVKTAAPAYIPAAIIGISTIACIFGANALNRRQQASLASAYALLDSSYKEYRKKVAELYGDEADEKVREEIVKDRLADAEPNIAQEKLIFYDWFSLRPFESTIEDVVNAELYFNMYLARNGAACLNDLYGMLGLPDLDSGYQLGWTRGTDAVEFEHQRISLDDGGLEGYIIVMKNEPVEDYL